VTAVDSPLSDALAGRYTLEKEVGRGGMATVYLAHDLRHDRSVALKVMHPELAQTLGLERFRREIEVAARLQHPHLLTVYDSGEAAGQLWFTMPFIEGESLRDRLTRQKQLPIEEAVQIAKEAAQALEYAHQHGVIHRDVKPENILLTADGSTMVADFGIARALDRSDERLTSTGFAVGTPAYMSPEQASGERALSASTDVYSLGCVLYEMLAGEPPFTGPSAQAILAKRLSGDTPRVRVLRPAVSPALERVLNRALAPLAADRIRSAADLLRSLAAASTAGATELMLGPLTARRRHPLALRVLVLVALTAGGIGLIRTRSRSSGDVIGAAPLRLAVLPFENLGPSEEDYFVDGMTDEVRGRLAALPAFTIIARASSRQYKGTRKGPVEIGRELGVEYLLTGTVRWDKKGDEGWVHVRPELIRASDASTKWQQPFGAPLADVFLVQGQIASQVAKALDLRIGASKNQVVPDRPTENLAAYDAFLKGEAARANNLGLGHLQRASSYYEEAVALDSTFALAWAQLTRTRALLYSVSQTTDIAAVRHAAERASTLAPDRAEAHLAVGDFYLQAMHDNVRALASYQRGLKLAPANAELLRAMAVPEQRLGQWDAALASLKRARELDPRSRSTAGELQQTLVRMRRYPEALLAADDALALAPNDVGAIQAKVVVYLAQGDLAEAQAFIRSAVGTVSETALIANLATYQDLYWVLDDTQQRLLLRLPPSAFANQRMVWAIVRAQVYHMRGELAQSRIYADSARLEFEAEMRRAPDDPQLLVLLGLTLAYLGRKTEAVAAGERATKMSPMRTNGAAGAYLQHQLVRIYIIVGQPDKALDRLEPLLKTPYDLSPGWLRIDPNFAPLRHNPRFQRLVEEKS
jgi:eukaryotic-like serine/threonine-protein kinase